MGTQGAGRKRLPNRERLTAEDDALNQIARESWVKQVDETAECNFTQISIPGGNTRKASGTREQQDSEP